MSVSIFNFHDLANFNLHSNSEYAHEFFREEYCWASESGTPLAQIHLHWQHSGIPLLQPSAGAYHVHKLAARWRYRIDIEASEIRIHATGNQVGLTMVYHMLVHPSLRYLVSKQGAVLLHGAALVNEGGSFVFSGVGGTGKTTTTSLLLDQGSVRWNLHADDFVFVNSQGKTFGYLTRAHLYQELLTWVPSLKMRLTRFERIKVWFFNLVLALSAKHIRWAVRVPLARLWPDRAPTQAARLAALLMLARSDSPMVELVDVDDKKQLLDKLLAMNMYEARHFIALLDKAIGQNHASKLIDEWRLRERAILDSAISNSAAYYLYLPKFAQGDASTARIIEKELMKINGNRLPS